MNPATICSGFKRSGIHPFNPDTINCSISVENPDASLQLASHEVNSGGNSGGSIEESITEQSSESASKKTASRNSYFSSEKLSLFQRRYKEGYDLPDKEYMDWLCQYHPDKSCQHIYRK